MPIKKITVAVLILSIGAIIWAYTQAIQGGVEEEAAAPVDVVVNASNTEMVALGKKVYAENCADCHGKNLEGQPNWQSKNPDGTLPPPPHHATGHTWHHPDALNFKYTKFGGQASAPANFTSAMPGFSETLSDHDIMAVLSFIKSTWPEDVRDKHQRMSQRMKGMN